MKVLVVEDDPTVIGLLQDIFKDQDVFIATSVERARELFREHEGKFGFVVMDGNLERGEKTVDLTREIRSEFDGPIVAFSGQLEDQEALLGAGCDIDLMKGAPGVTRSLLDLVSNVRV